MREKKFMRNRPGAPEYLRLDLPEKTKRHLSRGSIQLGYSSIHAMIIDFIDDKFDVFIMDKLIERQSNEMKAYQEAI